MCKDIVSVADYRYRIIVLRSHMGKGVWNMNSKEARHKQVVISRCEKASWRPGPERLSSVGVGSDSSAARIGNIMAHIGLKRRHLVERLLDRTLASYLDSGARREIAEGADGR